jgi:valyl-tRNA synthetase
LDGVVRPASAAAARQFEADREIIATLMKTGKLAVDERFTPGQGMPSALTPLGTLYLSLEGVMDVESEVRRLGAQREKVEEDLQRVLRKLRNASFVEKAPVEVVDQQRARQTDLEEKKEKLSRMIEMLSRLRRN